MTTDTTELFHFTRATTERHEQEDNIRYQLSEFNNWDFFTRQPHRVHELRTINQQKKNIWRQIFLAMKQLEEIGEDKSVPIQPILDAVRAWPEVVSCEFSSNELRVTFLPVMIDDFATSLIALTFTNAGYVEGGYLADNVDICHPHIRTNDICRGEANLAFTLARHADDLLGLVTIARQMIQGWNSHSELNTEWKYNTARWWRTHAHGATEDFLGWDCHSILDTDQQKVKFVETYFGKPLNTILATWEDRAESESERLEDEESECDNHQHCERCGTCCEDDYEFCRTCDDTYCSYNCLTRHSEESHDTYPCQGLESNWDHDDGPVFTNRCCDNCDKYICEDCAEQHIEDEHPPEEEEDDPIIDIPAPLPGQAPLITEIEEIAHTGIVPITEREDCRSGNCSHTRNYEPSTTGVTP